MTGPKDFHTHCAIIEQSGRLRAEAIAAALSAIIETVTILISVLSQ